VGNPLGLSGSVTEGMPPMTGPRASASPHTLSRRRPPWPEPSRRCTRDAAWTAFPARWQLRRRPSRLVPR
jgi:hypothetical protein